MRRSRKATSPQPATGSVALLIGTRKGAFILRGDRTRRFDPMIIFISSAP